MEHEHIYQRQYGSEIYAVWYSRFTLAVKVYGRIFTKLLFIQTVIFFWIKFYGKWEPEDNIFVNVLWPIYHVFSLVVNKRWDILLRHYAEIWLISFVVIVIAPFFCIQFFFSHKARRASGKRHVRGTKIVSARALNKEMRRRREKTGIPLGQARMPKENEIRGTYIIGMPGSGKTTAILPFIDHLHKYNAKGIIWDSKGDLSSTTLNPKTDKLFNIVDARNQVKWSLFKELKSYTDIELMSYSLIPRREHISSTAKFFDNGARSVFAGGIKYLDILGDRKNRDIWEFFQQSATAIHNCLSVTLGAEAGAKFLAPDDKMSRQADTMATLMQYIAALEYMSDVDGDFSTKKWLADGKPGLLYITSYEDIADTLRPIISLFLDLLIKRMLSMPDDLDRRIWFIFDEIGTLNMLPSVEMGIRRVRSKGGGFVIGTQDPFQIRRLYGEEGLDIIESACGNRITFALKGRAAEREAQINIGSAESIVSGRNTTISGGKDGGINIGEHSKVESSVMAEELNMRDLEAIVHLKNYPAARSKWRWKKYKTVQEPFELRADLSLKAVRERAGAEMEIRKNLKARMTVEEKEARKQAAIQKAENSALGQLRAEDRFRAEREAQTEKAEGGKSNIVSLKKQNKK
jgi:type IV secretory pathway TraG/TraD family ATPase VirD4